MAKHTNGSKKFTVDIFIEGDSDPDSDPRFSTEVFADDETAALTLAKKMLTEKFPNENFVKGWCWHIEEFSVTQQSEI